MSQCYAIFLARKRNLVLPIKSRKFLMDLSHGAIDSGMWSWSSCNPLPLANFSISTNAKKSCSDNLPQRSLSQPSACPSSLIIYHNRPSLGRVRVRLSNLTLGLPLYNLEHLSVCVLQAAKLLAEVTLGCNDHLAAVWMNCCAQEITMICLTFNP